MTEVFSSCFDFWEAKTMYFYISAGFFQTEYLRGSLQAPSWPKIPKIGRSVVTRRHKADIWPKISANISSLDIVPWRMYCVTLKNETEILGNFARIYEIKRKLCMWCWGMTTKFMFYLKGRGHQNFMSAFLFTSKFPITLTWLLDPDVIVGPFLPWPKLLVSQIARFVIYRIVFRFILQLFISAAVFPSAHMIFNCCAATYRFPRSLMTWKTLGC